MTTVNTAVVELKLNTKDFDSGIKSAQRELSNFGSAGVSGANKFSAKWSAVMGAIGGVASSVFNKVTNVISNSVGDAVKRVDTFNQYPKVLAQFGISADQAKASIDRIDKSVRGLPTSLDKAVQGVQKFFTVTNDLTKSEKLFQAVNDSAMVFAQGSAEAVERFSYAYSQSLAAGKVDAANFRQMNEAIPGVMAKVAESMGLTMNQLKEGLSNGEVSIDSFNDALTKLDTEGGAGMGALKDVARESTGGIETALTNAKTAVTRGIAAIIESIGTDNIKTAFEDIGKAFETAGKKIGEVIKFIMDNKEIFSVLAVAIGVATAAIWAMNAALNANPIVLIIGLIAGLVAAVVWFFTQTEAGQAIIQKIGEVAGAVFKAIGDAISTVVDWVSNLVQQIGQFLKPVIDIIVAAFNVWWSITSKIIEIFMKVAEIIWTLFIVAIQAIGNKIREIFSPLATFFMNVWNKIREIFAPVANFFGDVFSKAWEKIKSIFSGVAGFFRGVWDGIVGIFSGVGTAIGNAVGGAFRNVVNGVLGFVESFINTPINLINDAIGAINNIPGVNIGTLSGVSLPRMASGGIVEARRGGTPVILGEGGQNEWVVPESKMADLIAKLGGGVGTSVVQNNTINTPVDLQVMNQRLGNAVRRATA